MRLKRISTLAGILLIVTYLVGLIAGVSVGRQRFKDINNGLKPPEIPAINTPYKVFVSLITKGLAIYLGLATCLVAISAGAVTGLIVLVCIGFLTFLLLASLPMVYFPGDSFAVQSLWAMAAFRYVVPTLGLLVIFKTGAIILHRGNRMT